MTQAFMQVNMQVFITYLDPLGTVTYNIKRGIVRNNTVKQQSVLAYVISTFLNTTV